MKPYQCSVCNQKCASQSNLNEHISSFHDLNENYVQTPEGDVQIPKQTTKDEKYAKSHDEHDVTDEIIEKILPILEINEPDLDLNGNDSSYKLGIN